jgi:hypothetical protein
MGMPSGLQKSNDVPLIGTNEEKAVAPSAAPEKESKSNEPKQGASQQEYQQRKELKAKQDTATHFNAPKDTEVKA